MKREAARGSRSLPQEEGRAAEEAVMPPLEASPGVSGDPRALVLRGLTKEYRKSYAGSQRHRSCIAGLGIDRDHRAFRNWKEHADLAASTGWCSKPPESPVSVARTSPEAPGRVPCVMRGDGKMVFQRIQFGRTPHRDGKSASAADIGYVSAWRAWLRKFPARDVERAFGLLDAVGLPGFEARRADASIGRAASARWHRAHIMQEPEIILADEPDPSARSKDLRRNHQILSRFAAERSIPVIVNIHNVELARQFCIAGGPMSGSRVVYDGPPQALAKTHLKQIYGGENWME